MNTNETVQTRTAASWSEKLTASDVISKDTMSTFAGISVLVGVWAVCSFVGAMFMIGGPLHLARSWFSAVTGL